MSRQYNERYFSGRDDRDWLDRIFDAWHAGAESLTGIHRVIYLLGSPFQDAFEFMGVNRSRCTYIFPMKQAKRAEKRRQKEMRHARLDHELNRILSACAPFPPPKASN